MQAVKAVHSSPVAASAEELKGNPQPPRRARRRAPGVPMQSPGAAASVRHASTDREGRHRPGPRRGTGGASVGPRAVPRPSQVQREVSPADSLARSHPVPPRHFALRPAGPGRARPGGVFCCACAGSLVQQGLLGSSIAPGWSLTPGRGRASVRVCPLSPRLGGLSPHLSE